MLLRLRLFTTLLLTFLAFGAGAQSFLRTTATTDSAACVRTFFKEYADSSSSVLPSQMFITGNGRVLVQSQEREDPYTANDVSSLTLIDTSGNILASRLFNGSNQLYLNKVIKLANGNFAAAGNTYVSYDSTDSYVLEFDENLNLLWERKINYELNYMGFLDMVASPEGDLYLYLRDRINANSESRQLLKLNAAGTPQWFRQYNAGPNIFPTETEIDGKVLELGDFIYLKYNQESDLSPFILKIRKEDGSVVWDREYKLSALIGPYSMSIFSFFTDKKSLYLNARTGYGRDILLKIDTASGDLLQQKIQPHNGFYLDKMIYTGKGKIRAAVGNASGTNRGIVEMDTAFRILRKQFLLVPTYGATFDLVNFSDSVTYAVGSFYGIDPYHGTINLAKFNFESSFASCQVTNPPVQFDPMDINVLQLDNTAQVLPLPDAVAISIFTVPGTMAYERYYCGNQPLCSSVKVSGPVSVCDSGTYHYSALRNPGCDAHVNWVMETSFDSVEMLNLTDTSADLHIKMGGSYRLGAKIFGSCSWIGDSIDITAAVPAHHTLDLGPDTTLCPGKTITLVAVSGFSAYRWQDGSTDTSFTVTQPGTYFVTVKSGCSKELSDTVVVSARPPIPFDLGPDTSVCRGDTLNLAAPAGFTRYKWTPGNDSTILITVSPQVGTRYIVQAGANTGCTLIDSLFVEVKDNPVIDLGNDTSFCAGQVVPLDAGPGFDNYSWNTGESSRQITAGSQGLYMVTATLNGCSSSDSMSVLNVFPIPSFSLGDDTTLCEGHRLSFSFSLPGAEYFWSTGSLSGDYGITSAGRYWLQVTQHGCKASDTLTVNYQASPVVNLQSDTSICEGTSLILSAYNPNATYLWQDGSTGPSYSVTTGGNFSVTAFINGCSSGDTIRIRINPLPQFTLGEDQYICTGQQVMLQPPVNTQVTYLWQDGSTAPSFLVTQKGIYTLTASNECGSYTDSVTIAEGFCDLYMPNAFTPNGDGLNDVFRVKYSFPVRAFMLQVYNRFGEKVFQSTDISKGWDGTFKDQYAVNGVYTWTLSLITTDGTTENRKGIVTLIK